MQLTNKLLGYLHQVFSKDPEQFLALRLAYDGEYTWDITDGILTTVVTGGSGGPLNVDLSQYSVASLAAWVTTQPGYSCPYQDGTALGQLSALVLLDGDGDQAASNGDHLYGYTSILWAYLEAKAVSLNTVKAQIGEMLNQLVVGLASGEWLDELGDYYDVQRNAGELDPAYATRIIAEVIQPRANNVAIAAAIATATGASNVRVTDAPLLVQTGWIRSGNTYTAADSTHSISSYNRFDVSASFDLETDDVVSFANNVATIVESFRAAGTHLRNTVATGALSDDYSGKATDAAFRATVGLPYLEVYSRNAAYTLVYDGTFDWDGSYDFDGGTAAGLQYNGIGRYNGLYLYDSLLAIYNDDFLANVTGSGVSSADTMTASADSGTITIITTLPGGGTTTTFDMW